MPSNREHGVIKQYRAGCRCEDCKTANRSYMDEYRQRLRSAVETVVGQHSQIEEGNMSWLENAKCRGMGNETFFPGRGDHSAVRAARELCAECSVADDCLSYALRTEQETGIWGGKSTRERRQMSYMMRTAS